MKATFSGRCLCGAVTYEARGQPNIVAQCHCDQCRRLSGAGHTVGAMFSKAAVQLAGPLRKFSYRAGNGSDVARAFCGDCGSPIYGTNTRMPGHLTLTLGTMDDTKALVVQVVIFERDKQHWDQLERDVTAFATQPDWKPPDPGAR